MRLHEILAEATVVDFGKFKKDRQEQDHQRSLDNYTSATDDIFQGEREKFETFGKFSDFVQKYIDHGFAKDWRPYFLVRVQFKEPTRRLSPETRAIKAVLRKDGFKFTDLGQDGSFGDKVVPAAQAAELFRRRDDAATLAQYGTYQPSKHGFRTVHQDVWSPTGVGFNITFLTYNDGHIIDTEQDLDEALAVTAMVKRRENLRLVP